MLARNCPVQNFTPGRDIMSLKSVHSIWALCKGV